MLDVLRGLLLVVFSVGYIVPGLHFTLVQHEMCAEHGELRHSDGPLLKSAHSASSHASSVEATASVEHEHEHCAVLATSSLRATSASRTDAELAPAPQARALQVSRADSAHPSLELLSYAPKLAPPSC